MKEEGKLSMPSATCLGHQSSDTHPFPYPAFSWMWGRIEQFYG